MFARSGSAPWQYHRQYPLRTLPDSWLPSLTSMLMRLGALWCRLKLKPTERISKPLTVILVSMFTRSGSPVAGRPSISTGTSRPLALNRRVVWCRPSSQPVRAFPRFPTTVPGLTLVRSGARLGHRRNPQEHSPPTVAASVSTTPVRVAVFWIMIANENTSVLCGLSHIQYWRDWIPIAWTIRYPFGCHPCVDTCETWLVVAWTALHSTRSLA